MNPEECTICIWLSTLSTMHFRFTLAWCFSTEFIFHSCIVFHGMAGLEFVLCAHQSMDICDCRWNQVNSFMLSATCGYFMRLLISAFHCFFLNLLQLGFPAWSSSKEGCNDSLVSNSRANEGQCMCGSGRFMATRLSDERVGGGLREELGLCSLCLERTGVSGRILSGESAQSSSQKTLWIP